MLQDMSKNFMEKAGYSAQRNDSFANFSRISRNQITVFEYS